MAGRFSGVKLASTRVNLFRKARLFDAYGFREKRCLQDTGKATGRHNALPGLARPEDCGLLQWWHPPILNGHGVERHIDTVRQPNSVRSGIQDLAVADDHVATVEQFQQCFTCCNVGHTYFFAELALLFFCAALRRDLIFSS